MPATQSVERQDDLYRLAARLYHLDGLSQAAIAELIGVSRSKVSRILERAREKGVVRIWVEEFEPRHRQLEADLHGMFNLDRVVIIRTVNSAGRENVRQSVGYFSAPVVAEWLQPNMIVGVAGGRTLASLIGHIQPSTNVRGLSFVQLMGNFGAQANYSDAVELSRTLAERFHGTYYTLNSPAVAADAATCRAFLAHPDVQTLHRMFDTMQMAFVGIGSLKDSTFIEREVIRSAEVQRLIEYGAVGELCGRFFDVHGEPCDASYQERVVGIRLEELRQKRDVVAVTMGAERAVALYSALRSGLVNSLVADEGCAQAVVDYALRA